MAEDGRPTLRRPRVRARRAAAYLSVVLLGVLLLVLLALPPAAPDSPHSIREEPARREHGRSPRCCATRGVRVEVVRSIGALEAAAPGRSTTVLVGDPTNLGPGAAPGGLGGPPRVVSRLVVVGWVGDQLGSSASPARPVVRGGAEGLPSPASSTSRATPTS